MKAVYPGTYFGVSRWSMLETSLLLHAYYSQYSYDRLASSFLITQRHETLSHGDFGHKKAAAIDLHTFLSIRIVYSLQHPHLTQLKR